jgi:hypothetical protein
MAPMVKLAGMGRRDSSVEIPESPRRLDAPGALVEMVEPVRVVAAVPAATRSQLDTSERSPR